MSDPNNTTLRRKKRPLTSSTRSIMSDMIEASQEKPQSTPLKRRKRKLNAPATDKPLLTERISSSSPPPNTPTPLATIVPTAASQPVAPPKRSLRAASQAIAKREKERQIQEAKAPSPPPEAIETSPEKAPVVKKKRKLHAQKVLIPKTSSSQEYEEIGDDSYDKYLDNNGPAPITTTPTRVSARHNPSIVQNIPSKVVEPEPAIVIGVPTRKRRLGHTPSTFAARSTAKKTENTGDATTEPEEAIKMKSSILDLSQHTIIPNESYVAHLPQNISSRRRRSTTAESAISSPPPPDAIYTMDSSDQRRRSTTTESATASSSSPPPPPPPPDTIYSMENSDQRRRSTTTESITASPPPDTIYTMDSYTTKSSPSIFYDAISDFEDMNINDGSGMDVDEEVPTFWGSILKPFK